VYIDSQSSVDNHSKIYVRNSDGEKLYRSKTLERFLIPETIETEFTIQQATWTSNEQCEHKVGTDSKIPNSVTESCKTERKYVPLNQRTKTLQGIMHEDDTANKQAAAPYLDRYESNLERFRARREAIRSERLKSEPIKKNRVDDLDTFFE